MVAFVVRYGGYGGNSWGHQLARHPRVLKQSGHCKHLGRFTTTLQIWVSSVSNIRLHIEET
jgi:hypothetical protein